MKTTKATIKKLSGFRSFSREIILTPSSRFFIFGEGNNKQHLGAVVEGRIREKVDGYKVFEIPKPADTKLTKAAKPRYDPERKIRFFNELIDGTEEVASFFIDADTKREIGKPSKPQQTQSKNRPTHIRFWRKTTENVFARPFDGRRYFRELIENKLEAFRLLRLSDFSGENFLFYIIFQTFKLVKPGSYEVSVLDNGIMTFYGTDNDLTYYFRDQRLGLEWQEEIENTVIADTALLFEPRRAASIRHKIKSFD